MSKITDIIIRMYKTGTGDCFALKFMNDDKVVVRMMIDGGTWSGSKSHLTPFVKDLKKFVDNKLDVLVVTHEHKDHVHMFDVCEEEFMSELDIDTVWLGWTENDDDKEVKRWKKEYGQKKRALREATEKLSKVVKEKAFRDQFEGEYFGMKALKARQSFTETLQGFSDLHFSLDKSDSEKVYTGGMAGMENVKHNFQKEKIEYLDPGQIIVDRERFPGIKFYVLGPPDTIKAAKKLKGRKGTDQTYDHNRDLEQSNAFSNAITDDYGFQSTEPFRSEFIDNKKQQTASYEKEGNEWRRIDYDWIFSAGNLALRMNSATNNLSVVLAIEIEETGQVLLFPGDAEYGSWASWHDIEWKQEKTNGKHLTEDLLNRTVFYKVAHHLSHNGTAKEEGMNMMIHEDLVAMATLDYDCISSRWKTTMPNRDLIREIIRKTKGRFIVMNCKNLFYDLAKKKDLQERIEEERKKMTIAEAEAFDKAYEDGNRFHQYILKVEK